jgi:hypothetical protein
LGQADETDAGEAFGFEPAGDMQDRRYVGGDQGRSGDLDHHTLAGKVEGRAVGELGQAGVGGVEGAGLADLGQGGPHPWTGGAGMA